MPEQDEHLVTPRVRQAGALHRSRAQPVSRLCARFTEPPMRGHARCGRGYLKTRSAGGWPLAG